MTTISLLPALSILTLTACSKDDVCVRGSGDAITTNDELEAIAECETIEGDFFLASYSVPSYEIDSDARQPSSVIKEIVDHDDASAGLDVGEWPWNDLSYFGELESVEGEIYLPAAPKSISLPSLEWVASLDGGFTPCPYEAEMLLLQLGIEPSDLEEHSSCRLTGTYNVIEVDFMPVSTPIITWTKWDGTEEFTMTCQEYLTSGEYDLAGVAVDDC